MNESSDEDDTTFCFHSFAKLCIPANLTQIASTLVRSCEALIAWIKQNKNTTVCYVRFKSG